mmetsp:Transcript_586/g.1658  ORF Transcript_586/g.1658 Transcript_586/m.1658 type:complete len:209 (+) Transcript_586:223-849(+)
MPPPPPRPRHAPRPRASPRARPSPRCPPTSCARSSCPGPVLQPSPDSHHSTSCTVNSYPSRGTIPWCTTTQSGETWSAVPGASPPVGVKPRGARATALARRRGATCSWPSRASGASPPRPSRSSSTRRSSPAASAAAWCAGSASFTIALASCRAAPPMGRTPAPALPARRARRGTRRGAHSWPSGRRRATCPGQPPPPATDPAQARLT